MDDKQTTAIPTTMPAFAFARRRDVELENGFILAGNLIVDLPKGTDLRGRHKRMCKDHIKQLIKMVTAGQMADNALIYTWPDGRRPPNADDIVNNDELMEAWAQTRIIIAVRVDPKDDGGSLHLDSDIARRLGLVSEH